MDGNLEIKAKQCAKINRNQQTHTYTHTHTFSKHTLHTFVSDTDNA